MNDVAWEEHNQIRSVPLLSIFYSLGPAMCGDDSGSLQDAIFIRTVGGPKVLHATWVHILKQGFTPTENGDFHLLREGIIQWYRDNPGMKRKEVKSSNTYRSELDINHWNQLRNVDYFTQPLQIIDKLTMQMLWGNDRNLSLISLLHYIVQPQWTDDQRTTGIAGQIWRLILGEMDKYSTTGTTWPPEMRAMRLASNIKQISWDEDIISSHVATSDMDRFERVADMFTLSSSIDVNARRLVFGRQFKALSSRAPVIQSYIFHKVELSDTLFCFQQLWRSIFPTKLDSGNLPRVAYSKQGLYDLHKKVMHLKPLIDRGLSEGRTALQITEDILAESEGGQSAVDLADKGVSKTFATADGDVGDGVTSGTSNKHFAQQFKAYRSTAEWVGFETSIINLLDDGDTYEIIDACLNLPIRIAISWQFMLGDSRVSVHLHEVFQRLEMYRDEYPSYVTERVLAVHAREVPPSLKGFEFTEEHQLIKMLRSLKVKDINVWEHVVLAMDKHISSANGGTASIRNTKPPWDDLALLATYHKYGRAVYGCAGIVLQGAGSFDEFVKAIEDRLKDRANHQEEMIVEAKTRNLKKLGEGMLAEMERRLRRQHKSSLVDKSLDTTFMKVTDSKVWEQIEADEKFLLDLEKGESAVPALHRLLGGLRNTTQKSKSVRMRSPSPGAHQSSGDDSPPSPPPTKKKKKKVQSPQKNKHPDSGKIYKDGNHIVLVKQNGEKIGMKISKLRAMLPEDVRAGACLQVAVSNQRGDVKMKWCPCKRKDGHTSMSDSAHANLPQSIPYRFKQDAEPFP
jgi:hypothetical protein